MSHRDELKRIAAEIVEGIQIRASDAKKRLADIKIREAEVQAQLESANLALERLRSFQPEIGGQLQCPRCWSIDGIQQALTPISSDDNRIDRFRCHRCDHIVELMP